MNPPVALLIPIYNDPEGLALSLRRLPSDLPLDVVVVDDGSDPPLPVPSVPLPHRAFLLRLPENRGIVPALNRGLAWILERGYPFFARLDAGDVALPGRFSEQLGFLTAHPEYALVGGQVEFVDAGGRLLYRERYPEGYRELRRAMHRRNCFIHPAVMLRTAAIRELGPYRTGYPAAEDYELFFRIVRRFPAANLPRAVVRVRLREGSLSARFRRRQLLSRLRVQLAHFEPAWPESYLGVLETALLLGLPRSWVLALKRWRGGR